MRRFIVILFASAMLFAGSAQAQDGLAGSLAGLGFMNVKALEQGSTVYVSFEDSGYRGAYRAAAAAVKTVEENCPDAESVEIVMCQNRVAKVALHARKASGTWKIDGDYAFGGIIEKLEGEKTLRKSSGVIELNLHPQFSYDNHLLSRFCDYGVYFAPSLETTLWKGGRLTFQPIIPVLNNFDDSYIDKRFQFGVCTVQQDLASRDGRWYGRLAAGSFLYNHFGVMGNAGFHVTKNLDVDLSVTGMSEGYFYKGGFWVGWMEYMSVIGRVSYYWSRPKLEMQLSGGRFLYGDYGARVDVTRHFGEVAVGLFAIYSEGQSTGGVHFAIPFGPRSQVRKGNFAVRLPHYFDWSYNIVSTGSQCEFGNQNYGYMVEHRPDQNHSTAYWQPDFIAQYTAKVLDGEIK